jgi:integrase
LKAALNHAYDEHLVKDNSAWGRRVRPFKGVDTARVRYLKVDEAKRLLNACEPQLRQIVRGALESGARYSELARLQVADFNPDAGTLHVRRSKSRKERHIVLTEEGIAFFESMTVGRHGPLPIFTRVNGEIWRDNNQQAGLEAANEAASIEPPVTFHHLRHTWASLSAMAGMPLQVIARNLGHKDTRMCEKHYSHLCPGYVSDTIRAHAPRFGSARSKVRPLRTAQS